MRETRRLSRRRLITLPRSCRALIRFMTRSLKQNNEKSKDRVLWRGNQEMMPCLIAKRTLSRSLRKKMLEAEESGTPKGLGCDIDELSANLEKADETRKGLRHTGSLVGADMG